MRNYTAHDIEAMYRPYEKHITHVIVAHTKLRPYNAKNEVQLENMLVEQANQATVYVQATYACNDRGRTLDC